MQLAGVQCCEHCCIQRDPHGAGANMGPHHGEWAPAASGTKEGLLQCRVVPGGCMSQGSSSCPTHSRRARPCTATSLSAWAEGSAGAGGRGLLWPVWGQPSPLKLLLAAAGSPEHCCGGETARPVVRAGPYPMRHHPFERGHFVQLHRFLVVFHSDAGLYRLV